MVEYPLDIDLADDFDIDSLPINIKEATKEAASEDENT